VPVSVEEGIASELGITLGDQLTFDVQGLSITTEVANLRKVDWRRIQPNFFVVFPPGVLEDAPNFHIVATHVPSSEVSAQLQRAVIKQFPNVSAIDLTLVLETMDSILDKIMFVVRFMALLTVATGLLVLTGAVLTGKYQRLQESVLLRTLGASRKQIQRILLAEYLFLGLFASLTGAILSVGSSWALAKFVFEMQYSLTIPPLVITLAVVSLLVVVIGLVANRGVVQHPPLQVLRAET
jgi:putative ABC transport system permease protein